MRAAKSDGASRPLGMKMGAQPTVGTPPSTTEWVLILGHHPEEKERQILATAVAVQSTLTAEQSLARYRQKLTPDEAMGNRLGVTMSIGRPTTDTTD